MAFDFKKEFKEFYLSAASPTRLPDFITEKDVQWAIREATRK